jgi:translation initiation factor 3 subunit B|eukprot:TRINITY_DN43705_c0_g1_i1.p1 TRINITY_DN43705_c0_g1~~TRINITY_DN43705_c0_g1_i1.p1  ORF type:complete len:700 (+),score=124.03 TRINITY_DN43705_c0_g1_i1:116-2215(+)
MAKIYQQAVARLEEDTSDELVEYLSEDEVDLDSLEEPLQLDETFPSTIFISGVPTVGEDKHAKLMKLLSKLLDKFGPNDKHMPLSKETNQTGGFVIATYEQTAHAESAAQALDGYVMAASNKFKVVKLDDFDDIMARSDKFHAERTLTSFSRKDFRDWLLDKKFREQLLLRYQHETEIYWHDPFAGQPELCYGGEREKREKLIWCDWLVQWSPCGSYLATFHELGIALWGGPDFSKKIRFPHRNPKHIQFSPNEDYLLTWNGSHPTEEDDGAVRIFRVLTGECVKKCRTPTVSPLGDEFPHFLWSNDGKYFAECSESTISVRDTDTFELIKDEDGKKRMLKNYDGLHTFQWSPKDNILAIWTLEKENNPARLVLVEIPSRRELASRSRTQAKATMHWQSEGDYLCLLVTKLSKTKKEGATNLDIFRIRDKNIPVDIVQVVDTVRGFYWETKGSRFAVLTSDEGGLTKLLIFQLGKEKCELIADTPLPSNSFNEFYWGPEGQYFVIAALQLGDLLFGGLTADNKLEISHQDEHYLLTDVQWDPSGRYVLTSVTQPMQRDGDGYKYSMEAGYALWTFQGRLLFRQQKEKLHQVAWRPHPPSLLSAERQNDIRKNIKKFSKNYDLLDEQAKEGARKAFRAERDEKTQIFRGILERLSEHKEQAYEENYWDEAWEDFVKAQGWKTSETTMEEEIGVTEDVMPA